MTIPQEGRKWLPHFFRLSGNRGKRYKVCLSNREKSMKVRASIKADASKGDQVVRRRGRVYVINKKDPNRKQRQKGPARKK